MLIGPSLYYRDNASASSPTNVLLAWYCSSRPADGWGLQVQAIPGTLAVGRPSLPFRDFEVHEPEQLLKLRGFGVLGLLFPTDLIPR